LALRGDYLVCNQCRRAYPIRDEIPVLLVEETVPLEQIEREGEPPKQV
jgi:uncharacterized protein YbaR (Trm112 family)